MQAVGYMCYGFYLNQKQADVLKTAMITDGGQTTQDSFDEEGDGEAFSIYMGQNFPKLDIILLEEDWRGTYSDQHQERDALLAVYMKESMNYLGSATLDFRTPSQEAQDQIEDFKTKFGISKPTAFRHWICYEDN